MTKLIHDTNVRFTIQQRTVTIAIQALQYVLQYLNNLATTLQATP